MNFILRANKNWGQLFYMAATELNSICELNTK